MNTTLWLVVGLAAFDGTLLALLYWVFRRRAPLDRATLFVIGGGLAGFAVQALVFYSGAFLILQLATITLAYAICLWVPRKRQDKGRA
jgi:hypothetical protein